MQRTSLTHPLRLDPLPVGSGTLGLTFCPGKKASSLYGPPWARDLDTDLLAVRAWGARLVVTLMEPFELIDFGVPTLPDRTLALGMAWTHLPIPDGGVPQRAFWEAWPSARAELLLGLDRGERIMVHCRGGLGRTGLLAALLLREHGVEARAAIDQVRRARPGAIENAEQERFVTTYRPPGGGS